MHHDTSLIIIVYNAYDIMWPGKYDTSHSFLNIVYMFNTSPPGWNGRCFADDTFSDIFVNEKFCILIKISRGFVPKGQIGK